MNLVGFKHPNSIDWLLLTGSTKVNLFNELFAIFKTFLRVHPVVDPCQAILGHTPVDIRSLDS